MTDTVASSVESARQPDGTVSGLRLQRVVMPEPDAPFELTGIYVRSSGEGGELEPLNRTAVRVGAGTRASFDTFFNAFPAGYYRRWTALSKVVLTVRLTGSGRIDVYQSSGRGRVLHHSATRFDGDDEVRFTLPLAGHFADGGFYWFTVSAREQTVLRDAAWFADDTVERRRATIGICTFNRPAECLNTLATLAADPEAIEQLAGAVVVDQGDRRLQDQPGFDDAARAWGGRLRVVPQANLGGSGGFGRAMYEVLQDEAAGDVLLMDDDIVPEPESILRATAFASASRGSVLVHGHMLDLWSRTRLHNTGDLVDYSDFSTRAVSKDVEDVDLTEMPLAETPELNRRFDTLFGGWWMCLIPREAVAKLGLPLPIFIKWDDIEYGMRAAEHGYPTVTVPGIGVWHMPFHAKDVNSDWTAYFECRNRLLVALLYGDDASVRGTVLANFKSVVKALLSLNYSAAELHHLAIEDLFRGPEFALADLPTVAGRVRTARKGFADAEAFDGLPAGFESTMDPIRVEKLSKPPTTWLRRQTNVLFALGHALAPASRRGGQRRADLTNHLPRWVILARLDEALVSAADGSAVSRRVREDAVLRSMLLRAIADHVRVARSAPKLRLMYREGLAHITSPEQWAGLFGDR